MLAQTALLLALIAEQLRNGEPFDWFFIMPLVSGDHARQRGSHFGPQRDGTVPFVGEVVKLSYDFLTAL